MTDRVLKDGPYADRAERFTGVTAAEHNGWDASKEARALRLVAYISGLPHDLRWTKEFMRYVNEEADAINGMKRNERTLDLIRDLLDELETWEPKLLEVLQATPQAAFMRSWLRNFRPALPSPLTQLEQEA